MSEHAHGDQPATPQGKAKRGGNSHHNMPAVDVVEGEGLPPPTSEPIAPAKLSRFRIENTAYVEATRQVLTTVLITPPPKGEFVRVHPDRSVQMVAWVLKDGREHYLIEPEAFPAIQTKVKDFTKHATVALLRPYQTREGGQLNLWPLKMESPYSVGSNTWNVSAHNAARAAETQWLRITADSARGQYSGFEPEMAFADPEWPSHNIDELVEMASRINLIASIDHPHVRRLRGLI
jgi:hypothetical protein